MKAIILARESDKKQDSNEAQMTNILRYLEGKKLVEWKRFELKESSTKGNRKKFQEIVELIKKEKECIALVVDTVDRLQRSFKEPVQMDELRKANKVELHFLRENLIINEHSNSADLGRWDMAVMFARMYVLQMSDNVKRKNAQTRLNGEATGTIPYGYTSNKEEGKPREVEVNPTESLFVKRIFELYSQGKSVKTVTETIYKEGARTNSGKKMVKSKIDYILDCTFYYGLCQSEKYESWWHKYPRLVSKELFDMCQEIKTGKYTKNRRTEGRDFILGSGLMFCKKCGCTMTPEEKRKPNGKIYNYYACTNSKGICERIYVPEHLLLDPVIAILDKFENIPEYALKYLVTELRKMHENEKFYRNENINRIKIQIDKYTRMQDALVDKLLEGSITKEIYDRKRKEYADIIERLQMEYKEHISADADYKNTLISVINLAKNAKHLFNSSEIAEKQQIVKYLVQNYLVDGKTPYFTIGNPFNWLLKIADEPTWLASSV